MGLIYYQFLTQKKTEFKLEPQDSNYFSLKNTYHTLTSSSFKFTNQKAYGTFSVHNHKLND